MKLRSLITLLLVGFFMLFTVVAQSAELNGQILDSVITTKIKSKILLDKSLSIFNVGVETNNGIVTLTGNVDSESQASNLIQLAQSTEGVKDVDASRLMIKETSNPVADLFITAKVKGLFIQEKLFGDKDIAPMSISVETKDGIVHLTGTADSQQQIDNAISIAKTVSGVKSVESHVTVDAVNKT